MGNRMKDKRIVAIIPARYASSRFPGKPLALINGHPMIEWVFRGVAQTDGLDAVYVATDDQRIFDCVKSFGGNAIMTAVNHQSGSDRLAECAEILDLDDDDIILNIQGDEPLIKSSLVEELMRTISETGVVMGTLKEAITEPDEIINPNIVKVITDINDDAIYFSRSVIPFIRNNTDGMKYYRHIGLYSYRAGFLREYTTWDKSELETIEGLEQLRVLEHGYKIRVLETNSRTLGVDTPEQIEEIENIMRESGDYYNV